MAWIGFGVALITSGISNNVGTSIARSQISSGFAASFR